MKITTVNIFWPPRTNSDQAMDKLLHRWFYVWYNHSSLPWFQWRFNKPRLKLEHGWWLHFTFYVDYLSVSFPRCLPGYTTPAVWLASPSLNRSRGKCRCSTTCGSLVFTLLRNFPQTRISRDRVNATTSVREPRKDSMLHGNKHKTTSPFEK